MDKLQVLMRRVCTGEGVTVQNDQLKYIQMSFPQSCHYSRLVTFFSLSVAFKALYYFILLASLVIGARDGGNGSVDLTLVSASG